MRKAILRHALDNIEEILFPECTKQRKRYRIPVCSVPSVTYIFLMYHQTFLPAETRFSVWADAFINLISSLTSVFSSEGLFTPLTLWITGEPGSGKTQLALYLGSFYNKPKTRNDAVLSRNFLWVNTSTKDVVSRIRNCRDNTVILDDVKLENSVSLGEHKNTNLDILVRSIFDHNLNGTPIYSGAIVTGEYIPNGNSTLTRLILLHLKSFQNSPENLQTLSFFQDNGYLLTDFMILFLQWVCQQLERAEFLPLLKERKKRYTQKYMNKGFSSRNSEILTTLKLGLDLLEKFSSSYTPPDFQKTVRSIVARGMAVFSHW